MQMNGGKLVMRPETDVGSEPPLTSLDVTRPSLAAVKVDAFWQLTLHPKSEKQKRKETEREIELLKPKTHSVKQIKTSVHT